MSHDPEKGGLAHLHDDSTLLPFLWIHKWRIRIKCCCISKISNDVGRIDNFPALARKLFLPTELDNFEIWRLCMYFIYLSTSDFFIFISSPEHNVLKGSF